MKIIRKIIAIGAAIMVMAGMTGCVSGVEAREKLAKELLENKYGESFVISEYGAQEIGGTYYTVKAYAGDYPEIPFHARVDNDGKNFSDNYVARRVCAKVSEQVSRNLDGLQGYFYVFAEPMVEGHGLDQADMSIAEFVQHNPANRFTIYIFCAPDGTGQDPSGYYGNLAKALSGLEIISGGTIILHLTTEETLEKIQEYCESTDLLMSEYNELAEQCTVLSVPYTEGTLGWTEQQFLEEYQQAVH